MSAGILGGFALAAGIQRERQQANANKPLDSDNFYHQSLLARNQLQESRGFQPQGPTEFGQGAGIPTRSSVGLDGDRAFASTAGIFRQQLAKQLGQQTTDINREFSSSGRFDSGQRFAAIERAQEDSRGTFGRFLNETALQRFLEEQRLQAGADIASADRDARTGSSRVGAVGDIFQAGASIYASNPDGTNDFFRNLFGRGGGGSGGGNSRNTLAFADLKE